MLSDPLHQLPAIGPIDPEQAELFAGPTQPGKEESSASWIGHRSGGDDHSHEQAQGIDQEVSFASFDLFPTVVATLPAQFRGFDALAVQTARRGVLVAARCLAHPSPQGVMQPLPVATVAPLAEIPVHTRPFGILMGQHAPFDTPVNDIKEGIDHGAHIEFTVAPTRFGWWDQIFDTIPFGISKVCGVWIGVHPQSVPN